MGAGSMVPCIVFSIALGLAISYWRTKHEDEPCPLFDVIKQLGETLLIIIRGVMTVAPIGIFCYVA